GNLRNWWTEADRESFDARAAGLVDQFAEYEPIEGLAVNGELTLGENIADLGGVTLAFAALQRALGEQGKSDSDGDGLTAAQRFFISYATIWRGNYTDEYTRLIVTSDPHSPSEYRCNGILENFPPFAEAFGLEASEPLVKAPGEHIKIW
ncbi:MAG: M13 family metallopeptidase, partial [bacterium]|nr:M13 family metallopeptidase [bacterium]